MQLPTVSLEVERLMNLVRGFGWELSKQAVSDGKITVELVKETPAAAEVGTVSPT